MIPEDVRLRARIYTLLHRGNPGDTTFYARRARGSVLELGCGAGRITGPVARAGARVVGVDNDPGMLALAAEALFPDLRGRVRLIQADMCEPGLDETFDQVFIPYNALFALPDDEAIVRCLDGARRLLRPGGRVVFDAYACDDAPIDEASPEEHIATMVDGGARIDVVEWEEPGDGPCSFTMRYRYVVQRSGRRKVLHDAIAHHWVPPERLDDVLAAAGLAVEARWGDFAGGALTDDSTHMVVIARPG